MDHDLAAHAPTKRCADCGTPMDAETNNAECWHCRKCFKPASCAHNHNQWPQEQ
ncbi:hypothetical protein [Streptomyces sp. NBC_00009]|uniref:hypothetical protein n=1 Tax=Streptomyces sp. NBC_00009 TaxID=2975620 RepID=UPI00324B253F